MRAKRWIILGVLVALMVGVAFAAAGAVSYGKQVWAQTSVPTVGMQGYDFADRLPEMAASVSADAFERDAGVITREYSRPALLWEQAGEIGLTFDVPAAGRYNVYLSYYPLIANYENVYLSVTVDGAEPDESRRNIALSPRFVFPDGRKKTAEGNDVYPEQSVEREWLTERLRKGDYTYSTAALSLELTAGSHTLVLGKNGAPIAVESVSLAAEVATVPYAHYRLAHPDAPLNPEVLLIEAEDFTYKNRVYIALLNNPESMVTPYRTHEIVLNSIEPKSYKNSNDRLAYMVDVPQDGYYTMGVKAAMPGKTDFPVFIDVEIDGEIPFDEFREIELPFERDMKNHLFEGTPVYLTKGVHELALVINGEKYATQAVLMQKIVDEIGTLSIAVQKLTGNVVDRDREWVMTDYIPDLADTLTRWRDEIAGVEAALLGMTGNRASEEIQQIRVAQKQLDKLIKKPNELPFRLALLSQGTSSVMQLLAKSLLTVNVQSLNLDSMMVGVDTQNLPITKGNLAFYIGETASQLALSFANDTKQVQNNDDPYTLNIWFKRTRQYVDVLQTLCDEYFTEETGITVNLSLITAQDKLTLANAAGKQPDAVLGVDSHYINDLATRHSLANLLEFPDAKETLRGAVPGTLLQMIVDDKLYGLPEFQVFQMMYVRTDIFEEYGWKVPDTWDEVLLMLPQLHRAGMNFYIPLATKDAFKTWPATYPFYMMFHGTVYEDGYIGTTIDTENSLKAMDFMTELFMIYGMPKQVSNFANDFRTGMIPIGVSDFGTYVTLTYTAPEIKGRWKAVPIPGKMNDQGVIERWCTGGSSASCIFEASRKKEQAWQFIQWWLSEETQRRYTELLQGMYGPEYLWVSGNKSVLQSLPVTEDVRQAIAIQIPWIQEAPKIPGGYYTERSISDSFNRVVYNGIDIRSSVDESVIEANREIKRKMIEFGYLAPDGTVLKPYSVPSIEKVEKWFSQ